MQPIKEENKSEKVYGSRLEQQFFKNGFVK